MKLSATDRATQPSANQRPFAGADGRPESRRHTNRQGRHKRERSITAPTEAKHPSMDVAATLETPSDDGCHGDSRHTIRPNFSPHLPRSRFTSRSFKIHRHWLRRHHARSYSAAQMESGKTVLVTAALGGTGQFAVQLAKLAGNKVVATCGGKDKAMLRRDFGVDRLIDYKQESIKKGKQWGKDSKEVNFLEKLCPLLKRKPKRPPPPPIRKLRWRLPDGYRG